MNFRKVFVLPAGNVATLVGSADLNGSTYQEIGAPGSSPGSLVSISAASTINLGPYNEVKYFLVVGLVGDVAITQTFGGYSLLTEPLTTFDVGTKNGSSVAALERMAVYKHTKLTLTNTPITLTDDAGNGQYGGVKIYTFPEGLINYQGALIKGNLTTLTGTYIAAFDSVVSLGTVTATTGSTLTSTEADILQSTANATASSHVAAVKAGNVATSLTEAGGRWLDGTSTPVPMFLNFLVTDDNTHTSGTAKFTGTVEFIWANLGDA